MLCQALMESVDENDLCPYCFKTSIEDSMILTHVVRLTHCGNIVVYSLLGCNVRTVSAAWLNHVSSFTALFWQETKRVIHL